jgi:HSP20 family protein
MNIIKWNPTNDMLSLRNRMDHVFGDFFHPFFREDRELSVWDGYPAVDVYESDNNIVIKAELPGLDKDNIHIDVKDRVLTLKGERSSENEIKKDNYYRRERRLGKFERCFTLPGDVDAEKISADYKDGVLKIEIPKPEEYKPKKITVH